MAAIELQFTRFSSTKPAFCAGAVNHPGHLNCVNHSSDKCQRALVTGRLWMPFPPRPHPVEHLHRLFPFHLAALSPVWFPPISFPLFSFSKNPGCPRRLDSLAQPALLWDNSCPHRLNSLPSASRLCQAAICQPAPPTRTASGKRGKEPADAPYLHRFVVPHIGTHFSATACVSADRLGRKWVGIGLSPFAAKIVRSRVQAGGQLLYDLIHGTDIPKRTDIGEVPHFRTQKHTLFGLQEGICNGCRVAFPFRNFPVDHVIPRSGGGTDHPDNLQLLCAACNSLEGRRTQSELIVELRRQGIIE